MLYFKAAIIVTDNTALSSFNQRIDSMGNKTVRPKTVMRDSIPTSSSNHLAISSLFFNASDTMAMKYLLPCAFS